MAREILFKAKRIDNGEWLEGHYLSRYDSLGQLKHLISYSKSADVWGYVEVDETTICQYTGLTDKNGNKIWEKDIVQYKQAFRFEYDNIEDASDIEERADFVKFKNGKFYPIPYCSGCEDPWYSEGAFDFEVLGNIFDNLELLEG